MASFLARIGLAMAAIPIVNNANPFDDPAGSGSESSPSTGAAELDSHNVLSVDRNASLTLGTDALIVLDEGLRHRRAAANCCGLVPQLGKTTRAIPFYNVLWAELNEFDVTIHYALSTGKKSCAVAYVNYNIGDKSLQTHAKRWVDRLLQRSYPPNTKRRKRIKVLINPFGGQGYAQKLWTREVEPLFAAAHCEVEVEKTAYRGHAVDIAEKMDVDVYDVVACASGDGLPYEVFNGLAKRENAVRALRKVAVAQIPCGSGNAMSLNLNGTDSPSLAALAIVKGIRIPLDLVAITQGSNKYYSFLTQAVGIIAESDLGTESLRWMGSFRFTWGILVRLLGQTLYPAEVSVVVESDDKHRIKEAYRHAVQESEAALAKELTQDDREEDHLLSGKDDDLPRLRYGTVQDDLHSDFQTRDMPTLGNFYVGNMCWVSPDAAFFATSLPSDGTVDMVNIDGLLPRSKSLQMLASAGDGGVIDVPEVSYRKVRAYRITPRVHQPPSQKRLRATFRQWLAGAGKQKEGLIAIDGERVPFEPFQAEVVPGLATVLSRRGAVYEFDGLKDLDRP
ncbi:sphinganine kinase lcb4 [Vermiconidia calcicola]|uniref:Sphinganine kinase lcb4 n=1 Tax=Vermiconidia calcicola TaxID=1690605 RepID=A0ACC3NYF4_9PEZI|nr:sphinganine kinase lcb4 [Vermiconidia calcicola]